MPTSGQTPCNLSFIGLVKYRYDWVRDPQPRGQAEGIQTRQFFPRGCEWLGSKHRIKSQSATCAVLRLFAGVLVSLTR
jgi:hypothetical protein